MDPRGCCLTVSPERKRVYYYFLLVEVGNNNMRMFGGLWVSTYAKNYYTGFASEKLETLPLHTISTYRTILWLSAANDLLRHNKSRQEVGKPHNTTHLLQNRSLSRHDFIETKRNHLYCLNTLLLPALPHTKYITLICFNRIIHHSP